jgi:predicted transcriptional regulator
MRQATIRINEHTHQSLRELAQAEHQSMQAVLEKAVEEYRRRRFLEDVNAAYAALRNDPEAWQEIQAERSLLRI